MCIVAVHGTAQLGLYVSIMQIAAFRTSDNASFSPPGITYLMNSLPVSSADPEILGGECRKKPPPCGHLQQPGLHLALDILIL